MAASKHDFVILDGLRGIAALAIVTHHCPAFWEHTVTLFESHLAVDFFFVLSGFVLMHAYGEKLRDGMSMTHFMLVRLTRLYPLYLLALALTLLPYAWAAMHSTLGSYGNLSLSVLAADAAFAIVMLPSPISYDLFPLNLPAWSLFFELLANAFLALNGRNLTTKRLSVIVAASGLILCCAVLLGWFGFGKGSAAMNAGWTWLSFGAGLLRVSFSFFAGALTYRMWQKWPIQFRVPAAPIAAAFIVVVAVNPPVLLEQLYALLITIIVFPALVLIGASCKPSGGWARVSLGLGFASYGVYVLQMPVYGMVLKVLRKLTNVSSFTPLSGIAFTVFIFLFALVISYLFDVPVRRRLRTSIEGRIFSKHAALSQPA